MADPNTISTSTLTGSVAPQDLSVKLLDAVLGQGWENIITGTAPNASNSLIFTIFAAFNAVALGFVAALILYVIATGVMGTAHEGETLGKRYSTLWTPLRSAVAISMLMPLPWAQLSLLQAIVLQFMYLGIGGADYITNQAVDFMVQNGGKVTAMAASPGIQNAAYKILENEVIQEYAVALEGRKIAPSSVVPAQSTTTSSTSEVVVTFGAPDGVSSDDMGYISFSCRASADICKVREAQTRQLIDTVRTTAQAIVSRHDGGADTPLNPTSVSQAIDTYGAAIRSAVQQGQAAIDTSKNLAAFGAGVKQLGWASLGSWYWTMAGYNEQANAMDLGEFTVTHPNIERIGSTMGGTFPDYMTRTQTFIKQLDRSRSVKQYESLAMGGAGSDSMMDGITETVVMRQISGLFAQLGANMSNYLAQGDPVANMQSLGHQMIDASMIGMGAIKTLSSFIPDEGKDSKSTLSFTAKTGEAVKSFGLPLPSLSGITGFLGMLMAMLYVLLAAGVSLAYYLPAVPFILWTMAVIGVVIQMIEAMFAIPLWAAAHAIPEGEGLAGQHGKQGYMILLGVLARPALMVAGFFTAYLVMSTIGPLVGGGFQVFTAGMTGSALTGGSQSGGWVAAASGAAMGAVKGGPWGAVVGAVAMPAAIGLIGMFATLFLGGGIIIVATHKVFSLITWLPDNILKWIGSHATAMGEHQDEGRINTIVMASINRAQSGVGGRPPGLDTTKIKDTSAGKLGAGKDNPHSPGQS